MTDAQPSTAEPWTIGRLLIWTTDYLRERGSQSPRLDAEVLLAHARDCQRIDLYTAFDEQPSDEVRTSFRQLVKRRAAAEPVAYLVGRKEFFSLDFKVTPDVLIPRPETEFLVISLLDKAKAFAKEGEDLLIADVGTGSGILAICAAKHLPNCRVKAVDISGAALEVARDNSRALGVDSHIEFAQGDLLTGEPAAPTFDFIVSNPPYVSDSEFDALDDDVRLHEPRSALTSGPQGTELIERLISQASERLKPQGWLMIEISPMIVDAVLALFQNHDSFGTAAIVKDLQQLARVVIAQKAQ